MMYSAAFDLDYHDHHDDPRDYCDECTLPLDQCACPNEDDEFSVYLERVADCEGDR